MAIWDRRLSRAVAKIPSSVRAGVGDNDVNDVEVWVMADYQLF
jgi:hypothetical protein